MSEFALRFATDELERALRQQESARLAWLVARTARPSELDIDSMEMYCIASNEAAVAQQAFDRAQSEQQVEWLNRHRAGEQTAGRSPLAIGEASASAVVPSPVAEQVGLAARIYHRDD